MTSDSSLSGWVEPLPLGTDAVPGGRATTWALVLAARNIPHRLRRRGGRWQLLVPVESCPRAEEELRRYEAENRGWPPTPPPAPPTRNNLRATFWLLVALGLFHDLTFQAPGRLPGSTVEWHRHGALVAARVRDGEWWRTVTALTLHADGLHLAGNLVLGGILLAQVNRQLGLGLGSLLVLAAGILGNATNAVVRSGGHRSVGASTAVFGALGVLVARAAGAPGRTPWRRWLVPLGAGAGLIAFTGVGGARTDYLAHLFGFGWGLVVGAATRWPRPLTQPPSHGVSLLLGLGALALVVAAWALAIPAGGPG